MWCGVQAYFFLTFRRYKSPTHHAITPEYKYSSNYTVLRNALHILGFVCSYYTLLPSSTEQGAGESVPDSSPIPIPFPLNDFIPSTIYSSNQVKRASRVKEDQMSSSHSTIQHPTQAGKWEILNTHLG